MYTFEFLEYNDFIKEIMSEKDTLENVIDTGLNGKPSKEEKKYLNSVEDWAKYAFEKDEIYFITINQNNKPFASIRFTDMHITIDFLEEYGNELVTTLTSVYHKFDILQYLRNNYKTFYINNDLFLGEIISYGFIDGTKKAVTNIVFGANDFATIALTEFYPELQDWKTAEQNIKVNTSNNFIRSPKHYKDFEYLLDYQNNIKPGYFDLPFISDSNLSELDSSKILKNKDKFRLPPDWNKN